MTQYTREDLNGMTPEQVVAAGDAGQLDLLLGGDTETTALLERLRNPEARLSMSDVAALRILGRNDDIVTAFDAGRIDL